MIGQHVFLRETAFIGIVRHQIDDDGYVAESIGSHFDGGKRPLQVVFHRTTPRIIRPTWPCLRDTIISIILTEVGVSDTFTIEIANERCKPMVLHLLWRWHMDVIRT